MSALRLWTAALVLLLAGRPTLGEVGPTGPDLQVNTYTTGDQQAPAVSMTPSGNFVVVWTSGPRFSGLPGTQDGSGTGVLAQRYDATGNPLGPEFLVNTYTTGSQQQARVATDASGNFVVVWQSGGDYFTFPPPVGQDGSATGVFLQHFDAAGSPQGVERPVNTFTRGRQEAADVAMDPAGNAVVVWQSGGGFPGPITQDGDGVGIFGQRFASTGAPAGGEFQVNTYTTGDQVAPAVCTDATGRFVVVWQSGGYYGTQDGNRSGVFGQRFDAAGGTTGPEFQVNTYTSGDQAYPAVASDGAGNFVVAWQSRGYYQPDQDGDGGGVFARRYDATGAPLGDEFPVNVTTTGEQDRPRVAVDGGGRFVVAFESGGYYGGGGDGSYTGIFARHFLADGAPLGDDTQINAFTTGGQTRPAIAADGSSNFVVAWTGASYPIPQDGSQYGVFARRVRTTAFALPQPIDGTKLVLKDNPNDARRKQLVLRSTDRDLGVGLGNGTRDDPTLTGGSLRVRSAFFDDTYALPAANWRSLGAGKGYEYTDRLLLAGPIESVRLRSGKLVRVRGEGAQLGHTLASSPDPVRVVLQTGDSGQRFCAIFGGASVYKPGLSFKAQKAPAADCP